MNGKTTRVRRDMKKTWSNAAAAAVLLAMGLAFFYVASTRIGFFIAYVFGAATFIGGLYFAYRAAASAGVADCPGCDMPIFGLSTGSNLARLCEECGRYVEGKEGKLWLVDENAVAELPVFTTECPNPIVWPEGCCVCGKPATRTIQAKLIEIDDAPAAKDMAVRVVSLGTLRLSTETTYRVEAPHCQEHDDGVGLMRSFDDELLRPLIMFRSHAFFRRFCELNHTSPRMNVVFK